MGKTGSCPSVRVSVDAGTGSWQWRPRGPASGTTDAGAKRSWPTRTPTMAPLLVGCPQFVT